MTLSELGRRLGVSFQQIQKYERGDNRVGAGRLAEIARIFGVPLLGLFEDEENRTRRSRAHSEPAPWARELLAEPRALRLLEAFGRIASKGLRLAIVRLVEAVGEPNARRRARDSAHGARARH